MGPKINPCEIPKTIFRKSLNSEPTLNFCLLLEIGRNKGQQFFIETEWI